MADFFSDSDDEKAVEELLSQAMDSTVLEQVVAINCAGFTDSGLPSHLETRFQKLKSFPASTEKPSSLSTKSFNLSHSPQPKNIDDVKKPDSTSGKDGEKIPDGEKGLETSGMGFSHPLKKSTEEKVSSSPAKLSEDWVFSPVKGNPRRNMGKKELRSPSSSSWEGFSSRSVSPPAKAGCFLCSPKKGSSRKKNKENRGFDLGLDWGKDDKLLSDLSNFSVKSQEKMMKKAMKEEEKICREAEKIVKWAKHASARIEVSGIEDELSDDENVKYL